MKKIVAFILLGGALLMVGCAQKQQSQDIGHTVKPEQIEVEETDSDFIKMFSYNLFGQIQDSNENVVVSPVSVMYALSMTANGAQNRTQSQMLEVLMPFAYFTFVDGQPAEYNLPCQSYPDTKRNIDNLNKALYGYNQKITGDVVQMANAIWLNENADMQVKEGFLQTAANYYGRNIYSAPFDDKTAKEINGFVEKNTKGMIKQIVDKLDQKTVLALVNAISFDGSWEQEFKAEMTREGVFQSGNGNLDKVRFMHGTEYTYLENSVGTGFVKPYKDGFNFIALLPKEEVDINELATYLNGAQIDKMLEEKQNIKTYITVPKFGYEQSYNMSDILAQMGMQQAFDPMQADFTDMATSEQNLYIGNVIHKAKVVMDEKGTKAGAATLVEVKAAGARPEEYKEVVLDRPFVWAICDAETNTPLFMGRINNMTAGCGME